MNDMARYLGALYRVESSAVKSITFNGTVYTWNESLALKGSNWAAEDGTTLVSAIVKFYGEHPSSSIAMTLKGTGDAAVTLTFSFEITPVVDTATVSSADELATALSNESITTINLSSSFEAASEIVVGRPVAINGNSNTITSKNASENAQQSAGILVASDGVTLRNLTVSGPNNNPSGWDSGEYGIKVFNANDVTLENVTVTAANAGIQVNSSEVTLAGTITVSGNEFGGIEVCKSSEEGMQAGKLNLNGATVVCSDSAVPAIWIDGTTAEAGVVTGADSLYTSNTGSQIYYFTNVPASAQAQIGQTLYASLDDALSAVKTGETLTLHADATVSASTLQNAVTGKTVTIDVNSNALTVSGTSTSVVLEKSGDAATALTIKNGTLNLNNNTGANAAINIKTDSSIVLEDLTVNSTASVLYPQGDAASVTVDNCDITTSGAYAIATNSATVDNYNVVISVSGGSITMNAADHDSAALCLNVDGTMDVTGTTIKGQRQAVIVRAGTATFTDCTISSNSTPLDWVKESMYTGTWGSGNEVPYGALIVGNQTASTYAADANVTLTGCEISATGTSEQSDVFKFFAVYAIRQNNSFSTVINATDTEVITGTVEKLGENVSITGLTVTGEETAVTEAI